MIYRIRDNVSNKAGKQSEKVPEQFKQPVRNQEPVIKNVNGFKRNVDKACCIFHQLPAEVRSSFATLKVVPPNKVAASLYEVYLLDAR